MERSIEPGDWQGDGWPGRVAAVHADQRVYKSESLQVLLTVLLGFAHFALYLFAFLLFIALGPQFALFGIAVGGLEIVASRWMSPSLGVLRFWLLAAGVITTVYSLGSLLYLLSMVD